MVVVWWYEVIIAITEVALVTDVFAVLYTENYIVIV